MRGLTTSLKRYNVGVFGCEEADDGAWVDAAAALEEVAALQSRVRSLTYVLERGPGAVLELSQQLEHAKELTRSLRQDKEGLRGDLLRQAETIGLYQQALAKTKWHWVASGDVPAFPVVTAVWVLTRQRGRRIAAYNFETKEWLESPGSGNRIPEPLAWTCLPDAPEGP